jgi:ribonuclease Z
MEPGSSFDLGDGRQLRAFATRHTVPSLGYAVYSSKDKLLPRYHGLAGQELRRLRLAGEAITSSVETCDLAFTGDTSIDALDAQPWLYQARLLILEATFLDDRVGVTACRSKGHVHLDEILARADRFENHAILLTHFSARYALAEIRAILDERLPAPLRERVHALIPRG